MSKLMPPTGGAMHRVFSRTQTVQYGLPKGFAMIN